MAASTATTREPTPFDSPTGSVAASTAAGTTTQEKVWVGVRVRPLLQRELDAHERAAWQATAPGTLACLADDKAVYQHSEYYYNRVFKDTCSSEEVYEVAAKHMVLSAMEGYNCTIFAYGQTGAGKTTTMRSIMRQSATDIFYHISISAKREFVLKMQAIEVYNELVHDLFVDGDTNLKVQDDPDKGPVVESLTEHSIESEEHLAKMLKTIEARRQVRETKMNQASSRSHLVVRLYVESRPSSQAPGGDDDEVASCSGDSSLADSATVPPVVSTINFVDLAGSERLSQAGVEDADKEKQNLRQKETGSINKSLLMLGEVIRALGETSSHARKHIPYRNSKLTRILQPSLSGNSRMAIICTISPALGSVENTRAALHFANCAKKVTMRPQLNKVQDDQALIKQMEAEIEDLKRKLKRMDRPERSGSKADAQMLAMRDAELKAKEEQMQQALQDRAALERKLQQMERFILKGGTGSPAPAMRRSYDDLDSISGLPAGVAPASAGPAVRASWNPSSSSPFGYAERPPLGNGRPSKSGLGRSMMPPNRDRLLLDCLLPPGVRDAVKRIHQPPGVPSSGAPGPAGGVDPLMTQSCAPAFSLAEQLRRLKAPEGRMAQEALSALQAEVRCYSQQPAAAAVVAAAATATPDKADELLVQLTQLLSNMEQRKRSSAGGLHAASDAAASAGAPQEEDTVISALRAEVACLQRMRAANEQAEQALAFLQTKISADRDAAGDEAPELPAMLNRLQSALLEASDMCEMGEVDEECYCDDADVVQHHTDQAPNLDHDEPEVTSAERPSAAACDAAATTGDAAPGAECTPAKPHASRLAGGSPGMATSAASPGKSPRLSAMVSPRNGRRQATPNSHAHQPGSAPSGFSPAARALPAASPQVSATEAHGQGLDLGRMPTSAMSHNASDQDTASGGRTGSISGPRLSRWDTSRAKKVIARERQAIHDWYANEVARLKASVRVQAQADYEAMREALDKYKGLWEERAAQLERLDMQKKFLIEQVLRLELAAEEADGREAELRQHNDKLRQEVVKLRTKNIELQVQRDQTRFEVVQAHAQHQALQQQLQQQGLETPNLERHSFIDEDDSWAEQATPQTLLPRIAELWHELHIPLAYRSRFLQNFRYREVLYMEMEFRRLEHRRNQFNPQKMSLLVQLRADANVFGVSKEHQKAWKALERERRVFAAELPHVFSPSELETLYQQWNVQGSKGRKLQLVHRLWHPQVLKQEGGMEASMSLTLALAGADSTEQFMQLMFGNTAEAVARPSVVGAAFGTLLRRVTTPRRRLDQSVSGAMPTASGVTTGGITPRRHSSSFLSRLSSFVSTNNRPLQQQQQGQPTNSGESALSALVPGPAAAAAATPRSRPTPDSQQQQSGTMAAGMGPLMQALQQQTLPSARGHPPTGPHAGGSGMASGVGPPSSGRPPAAPSSSRLATAGTPQ